VCSGALGHGGPGKPGPYSRKAERKAGLGALGGVRPRSGVQQADGDEEAAAFAADDLEVGLVFHTAGTGGFKGIAAKEFGDVRGEIPGFEGDFVACAADVDGEAAEDAGGERRGIGFERERDKDDFKGRAVSFRAGEIH
jgi:hypothetical protein